jgi:hypothetical protein
VPALQALQGTQHASSWCVESTKKCFAHFRDAGGGDDASAWCVRFHAIALYQNNPNGMNPFPEKGYSMCQFNDSNSVTHYGILK